MRAALTKLLPFAAGLFFIYAPFLWCRWRKENPDDYGLYWQFTKKNFAETLVVTLSVLAILTIIALHWPFEHLPRHSAPLRTLNLAGAGLAAAVIEEIFFRGWIQPLFRKRFSAVAAIVLTGALFALAHIFVAQAVFLFAVFFPGCVMGFLKERHGNIATSTLFHALGNLWAIWFAPLHWPTLEWLLQRLPFP